MKLSELVTQLNCRILTEFPLPDRQAEGCYIGDLLSRVMVNAKAHQVWITIQSNTNTVAVASVTDVTCVLLAEGVAPDEATLQKANEQEIVLLSANQTSYELAKQLRII